MSKSLRITTGTPTAKNTATAPKASEAKSARVAEAKSLADERASGKANLKGQFGDTLPAATEMKGVGQHNALAVADWDFSAVNESELVACCVYEYARESPSILAHYNEGKKIESFPGGIYYHATVDELLQTFLNPFVWPWSSNTQGPFLSKPWLEMDSDWRAGIRPNYEGKGFLAGFIPKAFRRGDSPRMKKDILSRGMDRSGIDHETGEERIVVEIDWASYTDIEIMESFQQWVKQHRPPGFGRHSERGRGKDNSWFRKLDNLAIMRLLHHAPPVSVGNIIPRSVGALQTQKVREEGSGRRGLHRLANERVV